MVWDNRPRECLHLHIHSKYCVKLGAKCITKRFIGRSEVCLMHESRPATPPRPKSAPGPE